MEASPAETVLAAALGPPQSGGRPDVVARVSPELPSPGTTAQAPGVRDYGEKLLVSLVLAFHARTGGVPDRDAVLAVADAAEGRSVGSKAVLSETFDRIQDRARSRWGDGSPGTSYWSDAPSAAAGEAAARIAVAARTERVLATLRTGTRIASTSPGSPGAPTDTDGVAHAGGDDAASYVSAHLSAIAADRAAAGFTSASAVDGAGATIRAYTAARDDPDSVRGAPTGFPTLDRSAGGLHPGDLVIMAGAQGSGKSQLGVSLARTAAEAGYPSVIVTIETLAPTVWRRVVAAHARSRGFGDRYTSGSVPGFADPAHTDRDTVPVLDTSAVRDGTLDRDGEGVLAAASADLASAPGFAPLTVVQAAKGVRVAAIQSMLARIHPVSVVVVDYLALTAPNVAVSGAGIRESMSRVVTDAKELATTYRPPGAGSSRPPTGVAVCSPWQINREGIAELGRSGSFRATDMAETSEIERSADLMFALIPDGSKVGRAQIQPLKVRDGACPPAFTVATDHRSSWLSEQGSGASSPQGMGARHGSGGTSGDGSRSGSGSRADTGWITRIIADA